jgi:hypothetical protein
MPVPADRRGGVANSSASRARTRADAIARRWLAHNLNRLPPAWPDAREQYPEEPIEWTEAWAPCGGPLQYSELMPERENLRREVKPRADRTSNRGQQSEE